MKKVSLFLSCLAIVLAMGSAIGSAYQTMEDGYEFIDLPGVEDDECVLVLPDGCSDAGNYACKVDTASPTLKRVGTTTACSIDLRRTTPIPNP